MDFRERGRRAKGRAAAKAAAEAAAEAAREKGADGRGTADAPPPPVPAASPPASATAAPTATSAAATEAGIPTSVPIAPTSAPLLPPPPALDAPVLTAVDVLEGELAALLRGDETGPFRTWRPGSEPLPFVPPPDEEVPRLDEPSLPAPQEKARRGPAADPLDEFFYRPDEAGPDLPDLGEPEEAVHEAAAPDTLEEYLTFFLGAEEYGLAIAAVREVVQAPPITEVPRAPLGILGVVTVRGEVVIVYDPRTRLALPAGSAPEGGRIVVLRDGEAPSALLVDRVAGVVRLPAREVEPTPQGLGGVQTDCVAGIGHARDRIFTVLDVAALLRRPPWPGWEGRALGDGA